MQSRLQSLIESLTNIVVGLALSIGLNYAIMSYQGYRVSWYDMGWLGFWMTIASLVRSYWLRRLFNKLQQR